MKDVFIVSATGYRWIYGLKTNDEALNVVKRWYANNADLSAKHKLVVLMRDNPGEYKSDVVVLNVDSQKNTYTRAIWSKYLADSNELLRIRDKETTLSLHTLQE